MSTAKRGARAWWLALAIPFLWVICGGGPARADGDPGAVQFPDLLYAVTAGAGMVFIPINRVGGSSGQAVVSYSTSDNSATAGSDYVATSGSLTWNDGDASPQAIGVPISDTGSGRFTLSLTSTSGASFGGVSSGGTIVTHVRIDPQPAAPAGSAGTLALSEPVYSISSSAPGVVASVYRSGGATGPVLATYLSPESDTVGSLSWADGDDTAKSFFVPIPQNSPGSFSIALTSATGAGFGSPIDAQVTVRSTVGAAVQVTWVAPTRNVDGTAVNLAGYYIYFGTPGFPGRRIQVTDPTSTSVTIKGLVPGVWYFSIMAYDASGGQSELTGAVSATIQ
jgi:hypothetical protein